MDEDINALDNNNNYQLPFKQNARITPEVSAQSTSTA